MAAQLKDLDSDDFARRKDASQRLHALGARAEPALRKALETNPSVEQKRRIEGILDEFSNALGKRSPDELREMRAVAVLARNPSPGACRLLEELARGVPSAPLTQEAGKEWNRRK